MEEEKQDSEDVENKQESEKTEKRIDNNPDKFDVSKIKEKVQSNPWMIVSIVLLVAVIVLLVINFREGITGNVISGNAAGERLMGFANAQGINLEILDIKSDGNFYDALISVNGQESNVKLTKDGENMVQFIPLTVRATQASVTEYSEEDLLKINEFAQCLSDKGVKVYGANWCGYTKALVKNFGDFDTMAPIYIECTEEEELCSSEEVSGYPTIKINEEVYRGARTFEGLAEATGCSAPDIEQIQTTSNEEASCD